ncbi:MAG: hypothetical protein R3Y59_01955 [bacterium]
MLGINKAYFSAKNVATFYLFAMSIQLIMIEGLAISVVKVGLMAIAPFIWLLYSPVFTKATMWSVLYMLTTTFALYVQWDNVRSSTLIYSLLFLLMFNMYYTLIYVKEVFTLDYYIKLIRILIFAYAITFVLQQMFVFVGIRYFPIINLMNADYYTVFRLNALAIEPSQAARILTVAAYVLLKLLEVKRGEKLPLVVLYRENKKTIIAFIYIMLFMGSGTAYVGLAILSLYFVDKKYLIEIIPAVIILFFVIKQIDYDPFNRFVAVVETSITLDSEAMRHVDNSASARTNIIFNTIKYFDLSDPYLLFGHGEGATFTSSTAIVSAIYDYGLISYICKLALFFTCCFSGFFSLPVLMFVLLFSFNIGNIAYGWAALMMLSTLKYFQIKGVPLVEQEDTEIVR